MNDIPAEIIRAIHLEASRGIVRGQDRLPHEAALYRRCTHLHPQSGTQIIYTRDAGHHTSGWMKNPEFERCRHLSLSFRAPMPNWPANRSANPYALARIGALPDAAPWDSRTADTWIAAILGDAARYAWHEGPFSQTGKAAGVQHWRVFCNPAWEPIMPRGEVYSTDLTEAGWRSWSEVQGERAAPNWVSAE